MVVICGWCKRYIGSKEPLDRPLLSHDICAPCQARLYWKEPPTLVVSPAMRHVVPVLEELLRGSPRIQIMVERRRRHRRDHRPPDQPAPERRDGRERRRGTGMLLA